MSYLPKIIITLTQILSNLTTELLHRLSKRLLFRYFYESNL